MRGNGESLMAREKSPPPLDPPPSVERKGDVSAAFDQPEDDSSHHRVHDQQVMKEDDTGMRVGYYKMKGELMKKYPTAPRVKYVYLPKSVLENPYFTFDETFRALDIPIPNVLFKFHGTFDPKDWNCRLPERPERCPDACETLFRKQLLPFNGYPDRVRFSDLSAAFEFVNKKFPECLKRNTLKAAWSQWMKCPIMRKFSHVYGREYIRNGKGRLLPPPPREITPPQPEEEKLTTPVSNRAPVVNKPVPVATAAVAGGVSTISTAGKRRYPGKPPPLVVSLYINPAEIPSADTPSLYFYTL